MTPPAGKVKFSTKLSADDYGRLVAAAEAANRSVSAEAEYRLRRSLADDASNLTVGADGVTRYSVRTA